MKLLLAALLVLLPTFHPAQPLNQGHSHNDYWRPHPLYDALQLGFKSVEADVFLIDTTLQVGHERAALRRANTLQSLYLDPLRKIQQTQSFYTQPTELWLFVDFKNDGPATYTRLRQVLARYRDLLSTPRHPRPAGVRVILTGGYPRAEVLADPEALVFLDGQLADLGAAQSARICTVNGDWATYFKWNGLGAMPAAEAAHLRAWNDEAQRTGQKIRFWNTPAATPAQRRAVWAALLHYPAVLVGADELAELKQVIDDQAKL
ncbi:MAG TPA: hypothetical protein VFO93_11450 [Hymenobacter sp.]|uniref:hypothetical protein n=1 Tax=Hymenobacter sp. TaxID=1898978 RepID=UPI002D7FD3AC|nr:hypothetical protein [Hymenobacter sp.]HET9504151.1 hypothetical protein [Hymenobacter sp.]